MWFAKNQKYVVKTLVVIGYNCTQNTIRKSKYFDVWEPVTKSVIYNQDKLS